MFAFTPAPVVGVAEDAFTLLSPSLPLRGVFGPLSGWTSVSLQYVVVFGFRLIHVVRACGCTKAETCTARLRAVYEEARECTTWTLGPDWLDGIAQSAKGGQSFILGKTGGTQDLKRGSARGEEGRYKGRGGPDALHIRRRPSQNHQSEKRQSVLE